MKSLHLSHSFPANWMKVSEEMKLLAFGALGFTRNGLNLHPLGGLAELVDCTGLENRRAARYRGFESLSLRKGNESARDSGRFSFPEPGVKLASKPGAGTEKRPSAGRPSFRRPLMPPPPRENGASGQGFVHPSMITTYVQLTLKRSPRRNPNKIKRLTRIQSHIRNDNLAMQLNCICP